MYNASESGLGNTPMTQKQCIPIDRRTAGHKRCRVSRQAWKWTVVYRIPIPEDAKRLMATKSFGLSRSQYHPLHALPRPTMAGRS